MPHPALVPRQDAPTSVKCGAAAAPCLCQGVKARRGRRTDERQLCRTAILRRNTKGPEMLYQIYEAQRSLMEPFAEFAQAAAKLYSNPLTPFGQNPLAQRAAAGYELTYRLWKDYEKPEFGIKTVEVDGTDVVIHEAVEIDKPFCELRRFKR